MKQTLLLSILPEWAEAILNGTKKWEYRRVAPRAEEGSRAIMYASGSYRAIIGDFVLDEILREPLEVLIEHTLHETPHTEEGLRSYFSGLKTGSALKIRNPRRFDKLLSLGEVRKRVPDFTPPQNFIYLREGDPKLNFLLDSLPRNEEFERQKGKDDSQLSFENFISQQEA